MIYLTIILFMIRIIDGDTYVMSDTQGNVERVRLHAVDAYELNTRKGQEAKAFMERWLRGRHLTCSPQKGISYNRVVRSCCYEGVDIAAVLVNLGHAVSDPRFDKAGTYARPNGEHASTHCRVR